MTLPSSRADAFTNDLRLMRSDGGGGGLNMRDGERKEKGRKEGRGMHFTLAGNSNFMLRECRK